MASKVFIDANILLDYILKREHYNDAKIIIESAVNNCLHAYITSSVLHITGYWVSKAYGEIKAKELLSTLLLDIRLIDITHEVALIALNSKINDIEDALQYYTAIHHKIDYFISRDNQLQKNAIPILPVHPPDIFIKEFI